MLNTRRIFPLACVLLTVGGCGLSVPEKYPLIENTRHPNDRDHSSDYGNLENTVILHIRCEIAKGIWSTKDLRHAKWLYEPILTDRTKNNTTHMSNMQASNGRILVSDGPANPIPTAKAPAKPAKQVTYFGTAVTITLTFEDQSALNPGVSLMTPLENSVRLFPTGGNVIAPQSFSLGLGASGTANATRTETIQFTYLNKDLFDWGNLWFPTRPNLCEEDNKGVTINSDLKIDEFIYDKASIAGLYNTQLRTNPDWPPFDTFQEQITFVVSFGGNATPTWKFARIATDQTGTLVSATRTNTDSVTITVGQVTPATAASPAQLTGSAQALHNSGVNANQNGGQIKAQTPVM
jgi:hypothetical protein